MVLFTGGGLAARKFAYKLMFKPFKNVCMSHATVIGLFIFKHFETMFIFGVNMWYTFLTLHFFQY
jgi:hypothetical protein